MTITTELTLPERAAVALGAAEHEKKLALMAEEAKTITEIKNKDGREQCHSMMMTLKNARIAIEKTGKAAREDAQAFSNAVIAEQKRLIAITAAEEERLQGLRDDWDAAIEAERQAKIEAERKRVADIRAKIAHIAEAPLRYAGLDSKLIAGAVTSYENMEITAEEFAEFACEAVETIANTVEKLEALRDKAIEQEDEAARLKAEREELARLRAEAEARRKEDERIAAEKRAAEEAAMQAERNRLAAERAELERQQAEIAEAQRAAAEAEAKAKAEQEASEQRRIAMMEAHQQRRVEDAAPAPAANVVPLNPSTPPTLRLGQINERIGPLSISAEGLRALGFEGVREKGAVLFHESDFPRICAALVNHIHQVQEQLAA